jgi:hypothetical protein
VGTVGRAEFALQQWELQDALTHFGLDGIHCLAIIAYDYVHLGHHLFGQGHHPANVLLQATVVIAVGQQKIAGGGQRGELLPYVLQTFP